MASCDPDGGLPVQINAFITPSIVWATEILRKGMSDERYQLHNLEQNLSKVFKDDRRRESSLLREVGETIAVRSLHDSRKWHRGRIEFVLQLPTGYKYTVFLIDHGDTVRAKPDHIRDLPFTFQSLPPQAMKLILQGVVPMTLQISLEHSSTSHEMSQCWKPAADRFVEDIHKNYESAFFIECSRKGQTRFGDLFVTMPDQKFVSLSKLLCENNYAKHSMDEFFERQRMIPEDFNTTQIGPSPPAIASSPSTSSSCTPSPAKAMLPLSSPGSEAPRMSISEYYEMTQRKISRKSETCPSSKESSSVSASDTDQKSSKLLLLSKLKKSSAHCNHASSEMPHSACNSSKPPLRIPSPTPKALDSRYVPAGRSITNTPTGSEAKSSAKAHKKSYCSNYFSENDGSSYSGNKEKHHYMRGTKTSGSSDSSDCQSKRPGTGQTSMQCVFNAPETVLSSDPNCEDTFQSSDENLSSKASIKPGQKQNLLTLLAMKKRCLLEYPNECADAQKENNCTSSTSNKTDPHPSAAPEIKLQSKVVTPVSTIRSHKLSDHGIEAKELLERAVLCHGGFPPAPWMTDSQLRSKFSTHIEQLLINRGWLYTVLTLQKFMWPAIQKRQNVVMVSPAKSGKSFSYIIPLMDFMIDSEQIPKGNGPLVIILCAGSKAVCKTYSDCVKVVNGLKNAPRVQSAYGFGIKSYALINLVNGCEVFITTPPCLLRIMKDHRNSYAINFKRLCHYVLDQADMLLTKFLRQMQEIQTMIVAEQVLRTSSQGRPIQVIVSSETWEPRLLSFSTQVLGNPCLVINDCYEACVYGKPEVYFHLTHKRNKPTKLIQVLKTIRGLHKTAVFCDQHEIAELESFLRNECMDVLVPPDGANLTLLEGILHRWDTSKAGHHYILLCTDADFDSLRRTDATCVVHYSLPMHEKISFKKRLSSILDKLPDIFEPKTERTKPEIHLLMDETNSGQLPVIVKLMERISNKVKLDANLLQASKAAEDRKEMSTKVNELFCKNLKMYGECLKTICPNRHVFISEFDESNSLPRSGWVTLEVVHINSAVHFSVRLIEHISDDGSKVAWPSMYVKLGMLLAKHFNNQDVQQSLVPDVSVGDIFAVQTVENLYQRVQVLEVLEKDKNGKATEVLVQFLDEGKQQKIKSMFMLHHLPEDLRAIPAQVIDVFLCGLLPPDQDEDYGQDALGCVKKWLDKRPDGEDDRKTHVQGKIVFSMTGSLLVDPVHIMEWLPHMKINVRRLNIKESLLAQNYALENPEHISKLFKLCRKEEPALIVQGVRTPRIKEPQPKPEWAFLECDIFEDIQFMCAEDVTDVSIFFVQKIKFQPLLETLVNDLNRDALRQNQGNVLHFEAGDICLALYDGKWYRAQILSKNEDDSYYVFYVDYGNTGDVSFDNLNCIPVWAITRLPFQAIECSLAGVSSCDIADRLRNLTGDGSKVLYAKVGERKNAIQTGGKHFVVAVVHVDFFKSSTSIINRDLLAFDGVEPCQSQMKYLDFDADISMFHLESVDQDDEFEEPADDKLKEPGEQIYQDWNPSDLEFQDEDLSESLEGAGFDINDIEGFVSNFMQANPDFKDVVTDAVEKAASHIKNSTKEGTSLTQNTTSGSLKDKPTGDRNCTQKHSERKVETERVKNLSDWEEEGDFIGRYHLPFLCCARPPRTKWIEDLYFVWLKFCLSGVDSYYLQWTYDSINFGATVGGRIFHLNQQLRGIILPGSVKVSVQGFTIELKMKKACSGMFWNRPFAARRRFPWLSCDLEAVAAVSSDSDCGFSLEALNKEIKKLPVKLRRKRLKKEMGKTPKPDLASDSKSGGEMIDSDEMF